MLDGDRVQSGTVLCRESERARAALLCTARDGGSEIVGTPLVNSEHGTTVGAGAGGGYGPNGVSKKLVQYEQVADLDFFFAATYRRLRVFVVSTSRAERQVRICLVVRRTLPSYSFLFAVHIRSRSVVPSHCKCGAHGLVSWIRREFDDF